MKIAMVVSQFPVISETFILGEIKALIDAGHDVHIYANTPWKGKMHPQAVPLMKRAHFLHVKPFSLKGISAHLYFLRNAPYDVVQTQFGTHGICTMFLRKWGLTKKLVVGIRGYDISATVKKNKHAYKELFKVADQFLPNSEYFKKQLLLLGCDPKKITIVRSGIDCSVFTPQKQVKKRRIVTVGRLVEKKG